MLTTVSDRKLIVEDLNSSLIWGFYYAADVLSVTDYFAFGASMEGRSWSRKRSRFGFQGQEIDPEFLDGAVSYKYRVHDPRIGRFLSVDPLANRLPSWGGYVGFGNNPILYVDPVGAIFKINPKDKQAINDIHSLIASKRLSKLVTIDSDGVVSLDLSGLSEKKRARLLEKNDGLRLINSLATAKEVNTNAVGVEKERDLVFFYGTKGPLKYRHRNKKTGEPTGKDLERPFPNKVLFLGYFSNTSTTIYTEEIPHIAPPSGIDGQVLFAPGRAVLYVEQDIIEYAKDDEGQVIKDGDGNPTGKVIGTKEIEKNVRSGSIYHELRENLLRTRDKMRYHEAHSKAGGEDKIHTFIHE